jgi:hypothetical protein
MFLQSLRSRKVTLYGDRNLRDNRCMSCDGFSYEKLQAFCRFSVDIPGKSHGYVRLFCLPIPAQPAYLRSNAGPDTGNNAREWKKSGQRVEEEWTNP